MNSGIYKPIILIIGDIAYHFTGADRRYAYFGYVPSDKRAIKISRNRYQKEADNPKNIVNYDCNNPWYKQIGVTKEVGSF